MGLSPAVSDGAPQTGDPLFMNPPSRGNGDATGPGFDSLGGFQLQAGSAINNGVAISDHGGVDFWDTPLYVGAPDIAPHEAP